jgi:hypothetical protein
VPVTTKTGDLLTWAEAAVALGMSVRTLQRLKGVGAIGSTRLAAKVYFSWDDIEAYIKSQHTAATTPPRPSRASKSA